MVVNFLFHFTVAFNFTTNRQVKVGNDLFILLFYWFTCLKVNVKSSYF